MLRFVTIADRARQAAAAERVRRTLADYRAAVGDLADLNRRLRAKSEQFAQMQIAARDARRDQRGADR